MSYGQFLVIFLAIPLAAILLLGRRGFRPVHFFTLVAISLVALLYTAPWDNLIVINGVWSYRRAQIVGVVLGHVPLEEYVFYVLQVFVTGLCTIALSNRLRS